jgi:predicted SAM-dependent methyltransferase
MDKFKTIEPEYPVQIEYPRTMEYEKPWEQPPTSMAPGAWNDENGKMKFIDNLNKLNIGSYKNMFYYGWVNVDILDLKQFADFQSYRFRQIDVSKGLTCADNEVDIIFHSHLLEHFNREEGLTFLKECYRVLKPGGIIRISVPDAQLLTAKYLDGTILEYRYVNIGVEKSHDDVEALHELLYANHKTLYDYTALQCILINAGFKEIRKETPFTSRSDTIRKQTMNTFPSLSLIIEAEK